MANCSSEYFPVDGGGLLGDCAPCSRLDGLAVGSCMGDTLLVIASILSTGGTLGGGDDFS